MERPNHDLQAMGASSKQSRAIGLGITVAIQVGVVIALVLGLAQSQLRKELAAIDASVEKQKVVPKAPPPPPPTFVRPPPPTTIIPVFAVASPPTPPPITKAPPAPPAAPVAIHPSAAIGNKRTNTIPDDAYPELSERLREQGTVLLKVVVGADGIAKDVEVEKTSGFQRLDDFAVSYVKGHWRWSPATEDGKPVESTLEFNVKFVLPEQ